MIIAGRNGHNGGLHKHFGWLNQTGTLADELVRVLIHYSGGRPLTAEDYTALEMGMLWLQRGIEDLQAPPTLWYTRSPKVTTEIVLQLFGVTTSTGQLPKLQAMHLLQELLTALAKLRIGQPDPSRCSWARQQFNQLGSSTLALTRELG